MTDCPICGFDLHSCDDCVRQDTDTAIYFGVRVYRACWWVHIWKYVIRIGKPWGHPYKYAWRPLISFFRCWR